MGRIVITGAGGFLGKEIVRQLVESKSDEQIIALTGHPELFSLYGDSVSVVKSDDYKTIDFSSVDILLSLAYPTNPKATKALSGGLSYVYELLGYAVKAKVKAVVDISTQSVYGVNRPQKAREEAPLDLDTAYGVGKYCIEQYLNQICSETKVVHLRIASLIGPGLEERVVNKIIERIIAGKDVSVVDGNQVFGYMDYRDGAEAIITCINGLNDTDNQEVINISSYDYTLYSIVQCIKAVGEEKGYHIVCEDKGGDKYKNTAVDSSKMQQRFNWNPKYRLEDTIRLIFDEKNYALQE